MRTFTSLEIRFEYVLVGKLPNRRIIRRKIRLCDSGISSLLNCTTIPISFVSCYIPLNYFIFTLIRFNYFIQFFHFCLFHFSLYHFFFNLIYIFYVLLCFHFIWIWSIKFFMNKFQIYFTWLYVLYRTVFYFVFLQSIIMYYQFFWLKVGYQDNSDSDSEIIYSDKDNIE